MEVSFCALTNVQTVPPVMSVKSFFPFTLYCNTTMQPVPERSWLILPLNRANKVRWDHSGTAIDVSLE